MNWEIRRPNEPTCDYLGRVLDDYLSLPDMARRARAAHFDDYFAPPEVADGAELIRLVIELRQTSRERGRNDACYCASGLKFKRCHMHRIDEVIAAVKAGEFDGTTEESARWEASLNGQAAMNDPAAAAFAKDVMKKAKDPATLDAASRALDRFIDERVGASPSSTPDESEPEGSHGR